ncbi:tetratricopeptide repeat protein [Dactylosporangium sp. NPDC050588]|uniref:ATP-binding protein n=1 Tax=Dactylosporangium sp. NPDC050588 TaxID=3157211 RepID=UPI0033DB6BBF
MDELLEDAAKVGTMGQLARVLRELRVRESGQAGQPRLTYRRIAALTGWSHGIVGEYLAGRVLPPTDRFDELVRLLGATPDEQRALASARDRVEELRAAGVPKGEEAPRQLPADLVMFAGRTGQLAHLDGLLDRRRRAIVVSGTAGVGKTALAVHWAHRMTSTFPDGQLFLDLRGFGPSSRDPVSPFDALGVALGLLGVPPAQVPADAGARARRYRQLLRDKRMLIVLDNASTAEQVRPLLPGTGAALALVTSRSDLTELVVADGAYPVTLDLLDVGEARALLAGRIGAARAEREPAAVDAIVAACARLPLALSVVAARAALHPDFSLAAIAADLTGARSRLDALRSDDPKADVETVFSWSYQRLSPDAQRLFRLGGLHPGPQLGIAAAAAIAGLPRETVLPLLAELVRAQLVIEGLPGRFGMHDLLCAYAADLTRVADPASERAAARKRLISHYVEAATAAAMALNPSRDPAGLPAPAARKVPDGEAAAWFEEERTALIGTVQLAVACGADREAWRLAWAMADHLDRSGRWGDWIATQRAAVGAAERLGDRAALALAHRSLSGGLIRSGRHEEARRHLRVAFDLFVELADHAGAARCQHALAWLLETQDRFAEAVAHDERALKLFGLADDPVGQARALNSVGWHRARLGHHDVALECCEEALELQRALGDAAGVAATLDSLGYIHHRLGDHDRAIERYQDALLRYAEQGDRFNEADTSIRLGDTWAAAGRWDQARAAWTRSLSTLDVLAHPKAGEVRSRLQHRGAGPTTLSGPLLPIPAN